MNKVALKSPDSFGDIRTIKISAIIGWTDLFKPDAFPEECNITITYDNYEQGWAAFNVKKEDFEKCIDDWEKHPIIIDENDIWIKIIDGNRFVIQYYSLTRNK